MSDNLSAIAYLAAAVCFILALKGLSSPTSARSGNIFGIVGMALAIGTTLLHLDAGAYGWIVLAMVIGGGTGAVSALRIEMTASP